MGLLYLRARYYWPEIQSFLTRDPASSGPGKVGAPQLYIYAADNPLRYRDPSGLSPNPGGCWRPLCEWIEPPPWWDGPPIQVATYQFNPWLPSGWQNRPLYLNVEELPERYVLELDITDKKICTIYAHCQRTGLDPLLMLSILVAEGTGSFDTCDQHKCSPEFFDADTRVAANTVQRLKREWWELDYTTKRSLEEPDYDPWERDWIYYLNWGDGTYLYSPPAHHGGYAVSLDWQKNTRAEYRQWLDVMHMYRRMP